jgi:glutathione S-transferase
MLGMMASLRLLERRSPQGRSAGADADRPGRLKPRKTLVAEHRSPAEDETRYNNKTEFRPMIMIRHIEGRRSERVAWLLEELGVPYELDFIQGDILGSLLALEKHHEMRMTPIVEDGDVVMVESSAILEYILAKYGKGSTLRPAEDSKEFPAYLEFLHFAEGTAMQKIIADRMTQALFDAQKKAATYVEPPKLAGVAGSRSGSERVLHYAENTLAKRPYFAGNAFTAADIMMHVPLKFGAPVAGKATANIAQMQTTEGDYWNAFPKVKDFMERLAARPAFQRAMKSTMPKGPPAM